MLYDRWRTVAGSNPDRLALHDVPSGRRWRFDELFREGERTPSDENKASPIFPSGLGPEFIFAVLRAWRTARVVVPLEPDQSPPPISGVLPDGVVHLKTTSATTGLPRLIGFTANQLAADAANIMATMGLRSDWPNVATISLAHSYGFSNLVLPLLLHGVPLVLAGSALPESLRRALECVDQATLPAVPALWRTWLEAEVLSSRIRLAISAGAPLSPQLEQAVWDQTTIKVHNFYGSSECGGIAYDGGSEPRQDSTFVGMPMQGVNLIVGDGQCIRVMSQAVGWGYWPQPDERLGSGVFQTGDLGEIRNGAVHLHGRACDRINVAGRKISPETTERLLVSHPNVEDCLVFGVPDGDARNEIVVACVVARGELDAGILRQYLAARLPAWQLPRDWWFVPDLHSNPRGKRSRAAWRERYRAERESDRL